MKRLIMSLLLSASLAACAQAAKQSSNSGSGAAASSGSAATSTTGADATTASADTWESGYYTGFDGQSKFSLLLPSFRPMTVADPSIATIEAKTVTLSAATIDALVAEEKAKNSSFDETNLRKMLTRTKTVYKLTPLKAGKTTLVTADQGKGPQGGTWKKGQSTVLVVAAYTPEQVAAGKARYKTDGGGNLKSCASCHETGDNGAPSHELGNVMSIPDNSTEQWITTGKLAGRVASINHTWEFASSDEELGVVAYLRTLQTDDLETLTKMEFENQVANMPAPPANGTAPAGG